MIDPLTATGLMLTITSVGIAANVTAFVLIFRCKYLHNTFGALCGTSAVCNFLLQMIFIVWCAMGREIFIAEMFTGTIGKQVGRIALTLLYVCCYTHFAVAVNRFFSVYFPLRYLAAKSGKRKTIIIISLVVAAALIQSSPLSLVSDCYFIYDGTSWFWLFAETESCQFFETYIDFSLSATFFCIILCFDAASFVMIQKTLNKIVIGAANDKRNNNEMLFFKQSICQMLTYLVGYFFFDVVSRMTDNEWVIFLSTTFTWSAFHAVEGIVMVYFQIRLLLIRSKNGGDEVSKSTSTIVRAHNNTRDSDCECNELHEWHIVNKYIYICFEYPVFIYTHVMSCLKSSN